MNNSVQCYAPKTKTFCRTTSLETRVGIAAAVMALGYEEFWTQVFVKLGLEMDDVFSSSLLARDQKKGGKSETQKSKKGRIKRRKNHFQKYETSQQEKRTALVLLLQPQ